MRERMGMGKAQIRGHTGGVGPFLILLAVVMALGGCQKTDDLLPPSSTEVTTLHAVYRSAREFQRNPIELDGQAVEQEWGGATIPFHNIRVSVENGAGDPEPPRYVSVKAIYTDQEIFFLIRWSDSRVNALRDAMQYVGPSLADNLTGQCQPGLQSEANWIRNPGDAYNEDQIAFAFEIEEAGDETGSYAERGCQVACHTNQTPSFGRIEFGRLDIWHWMAARTNPVRDLFNDTDNPENPVYGIPGYLDDLQADPFAGLTADPGTAAYRPNFRPGSDVPLYVYRERDDPFARPLDPDRCRNSFGERCRVNNGVDMTYIWREQIEISVDAFSPCDTVLANPIPIGTASRKWRRGDLVAGWILTYPTGSRADVRGKAIHENGVWNLEVGRRLNTGDPLHDVIFEPASGKKYLFTVAVMDNSSRQQLGSEPHMLVFQAPSAR